MKYMILEMLGVQQCYGLDGNHTVRRREEHILRRALNFEVEGRRPPGRPKKTWRKVVEEDMTMLNITEEMSMDRQQWRRLISRPMDVKQ